MAVTHPSVDDYVASFPDEQRAVLGALRDRILALLPGAEEKISYQIPTVTLDGAAVLYYAGWKRHLSIYPVPRGDAAFEAVVGPHRAAKDAVHLRYDRPLPDDVVRLVVAALHDRHRRSVD